MFITLICDPITKFKGHFYSKRAESRAFVKLPTHIKAREGSADKWLRKNLSQCVVEEDPECVIRPGQVMSTPIVSTNNFKALQISHIA